MIIGEKNGVIRCQPIPSSKKVEDIQNYWSYGFHDNDYGVITDMDLSFNQRFLFTVGADSNIFGILFNCDVDELEKAKQEKIKIGNNVNTFFF